MRGVERVVAGAGGSPGSLAALRYAEVLALAHDAVLVPVLAWTPPDGGSAGRLQPSGHLRQEWHDMAKRRLDEVLLAVWGEIPASPLVQPQLQQGSPGRVLVSIARRPGDILVIGAGRRGRFRRKVGCGVCRYCAAHADCPVVLVPPPRLIRESGIRRIAWELSHRTFTAEQILRDQGQEAAG
jgi:nucleotide-binding universal stress UspA family protein